MTDQDVSSEQGKTAVSLVEQFQKDHTIQMEPDEVPVIIRAIKESGQNSLMVEWGSGASTIRWLQEMNADQRLISIEHNKQWHSLVEPVIASSPELAQKVRYYLCEPNRYWKHGYGNTAEENPMGLDRYFCPDEKAFDADIFLIDGVARGVCALMVLLRSRKPDPIIFLHDWERRQPWYSWAVQMFPRVERVGTTLVRLSKA
jgi:hypothetical protein